MRESVRDPERLRHIVDAIDNVFEFAESYKGDESMEDKKTYFAIVKNIEIIGEASYMLTREFKESHPDTPWAAIEGMRHFLVHGYYNVDKQKIKNVIENDLATLRAQVVAYLSTF